MDIGGPPANARRLIGIFGRWWVDSCNNAQGGAIRTGWGGMVQVIVDELGIQLDENSERHDRGYASKALDTPMIHVAKGTGAAVWLVLKGRVDGRLVVVAALVRRLRADLAPEWPNLPDGRRGVRRCIVRASRRWSWMLHRRRRS